MYLDKYIALAGKPVAGVVVRCTAAATSVIARKGQGHALHSGTPICWEVTDLDLPFAFDACGAKVSLKPVLCFLSLLVTVTVTAQTMPTQIQGWSMQDSSKVLADGAAISQAAFKPDGWYRATVPGTVLTTLVNNKVYPEPLYGENMRKIPESLNKASYWYRASFVVPAGDKGRHVWLHFGGINYSAEVWVNGHPVGTMLGAFIRGDFDITRWTHPGKVAGLAVLVHPQPHPGLPHEHTVALGIGKNGGESAIDGPTFLSTVGWDWLMTIRDRDTGIWLPVTLDSTGPVTLEDPFITSVLSSTHASADLTIKTGLKNLSKERCDGTLVGTISGHGLDVTFQKTMSLLPSASTTVALDASSIPELHILSPSLWWPNGYGKQNLYKLSLTWKQGGMTSDQYVTHFGIRKITYSVPDSEYLTISVNDVKVMVRGGDWGLDEAMKRVSYKRLDAQFHMHALANLNMIRNWVGQSTSPAFYDLADKYGMLLWDEFFQPNPSDGPNVENIPPYLANVRDKVLRYRNHPSIAVWCARNEGYPPKELNEELKSMMEQLDPTRTYQANSADGRGVSSHGPYYWRSPRYFYAFNEAFKTETGSMSVPTIESIQGMMPQRDWETIDDDWAQHDMARGAQRGDEYPATIAKRYGNIRNLADFVRKSQLANYEAFRAMYESRNAEMFRETTGVITWMSHPAQPSFVWQLYHYDLEPNAALFATEKAGEIVHVQLNEARHGLEIVNNTPKSLRNLKLVVTSYTSDSKIDHRYEYAVPEVPASTTWKAAQLEVNAGITPLFFVRLDLFDATGQLVSTNFYWQNVAQDDFSGLEDMPKARVAVTARSRRERDTTIVTVTLTNQSDSIALMTHLQLHRGTSKLRVLPVFYSDNYLSLVPGEVRKVSIEASTDDLAGEEPLLEVDGFNLDLLPLRSDVPVISNENADPMKHPPSELVPAVFR
jgi:mannosylglycoprotein endo-beta-mannosidase